MSNQTTAVTFEQSAKVADVIGGAMANFASELVDTLRGIGREASAILAAYQQYYAGAINKAVAARNLAAAAGDMHLEAAWRAAADDLSARAFALADSAKTAAERITIHDNLMTSRLASLGRYVGPAFDTFKVFDAIASGSGEKAGEAALSIALGGIGGVLGGIAGSLLFPGPGTVVGMAIGAGLGSALGAVSAEYVNALFGITDQLANLGRLLPDGFWRGLDAIAYGAGSAHLEPANAGIVGLLLWRLDPTLTSDGVSVRGCLNFRVRGAETCPRRRASLATNARRGGQVGRTS